MIPAPIIRLINAYQQRQARRGFCAHCGRPLPAGARSRYCDDPGCAEESAEDRYPVI